MNIQKNISLRSYNTFAVDVVADTLIEAENASEMLAYLRRAGDMSQALIIGGGSNILFATGHCQTVIHPAWTGIHLLRETNNAVWLRVEAGEAWDDVVAWCVEREYAGAENLSGIPGTAGASAVQNIGAYGAEAKDLIDEVEAFDLKTLQTLVFTNVQCAFHYRSSVFKRETGRYLILAVTYKLSKCFTPNLSYAGLQPALDGRALTLSALREAVLDIRSQKLPDYQQLGNAGSFFKNPILPLQQAEALRQQHPDIPMFATDTESRKTSAAWLIDRCGWKGVRRGAVGCYERQPLILVNHGGASGREVMAFADEIIASVAQRFGVRLEPEVVVV